MNERPYKVQDGNNIPIQAPFYSSAFVPYKCTDSRSVSVWVRVDPDLIKKYLEPTPFEYVDNVFNLSITDLSNLDRHRGFYDCSLIIPVKYNGAYGGYTLFAYNNEDYAIAAGIELWGYPRRYGNITLTESIDKVVGVVNNRNREFIRIEFNKNKGSKVDLPDNNLYPHLMLQTIPNAEDSGIYLQRVLSRDTSIDFKTRVFQKGKVELSLTYDGSLFPLDEFASGEVIGGTFTKGEFAATEENGWAKVLETLIKPQDIIKD